MRDTYLVRLFEGGGKGGLEGVKGAEKLGGEEGIEFVFKAEEGKGRKVCGSLKEFEEGLKEMSNGLFENRAFFLLRLSLAANKLTES